MRAIGDQAHHIHFSAHFHVFPGAGNAVLEAEFAIGRHRHVHEEIDVGHQVALAQSQFRGACIVAIAMGEAVQEVVAATVHVAFVQRIANHVALGSAGAAQRIVAATGVGDDGQHGIALAGIEHRSRGEVERTLMHDRIGGAVVLFRIGRGIKQGVHGLIALQVENAEYLAAAQGLDPRLTGAADLVDHGTLRVKRTGD